MFLWALLVLAAALVGGLAAAALVHANLVIALLVAVVAAGICIAVFRSRSAAPRPLVRTSAPPTLPSPVVPPARATVPPVPPTPTPDPTRGQQTETAVQLLSLPPVDGGGRPAGQSWWDAAQGAPPPAPSERARRAQAPDLSTYLASTFVAQCPRCGAFDLDIRPARSGWDFRCESCENIWTWQPGTPWPPIRVNPGRRVTRPPSG